MYFISHALSLQWPDTDSTLIFLLCLGMVKVFVVFQGKVPGSCVTRFSV